MPSWRKVIVSGSDASLNSLNVPSITGSLQGTASYALTSGTSQNASDILIYVKNTTGQSITKGKVVRIIGSTGDNALIATASYESDSVSANTLGITNSTIANDAFGYVITEGTLLGINTDAWTAGQLLFLGAAGSITGSAPLAPLHAVRLGQVLRVQQNNGSMYVRIDNGYELNELHDVDDNTTTSSYGDLLVKSGSVWTNSRQLTGSYGLTGSLTITGSTTTDLVRITQTGAGNAFVVEDSANPDSTPFVIDATGEVGIGTLTPVAPLHVKPPAPTTDGQNSIMVETNAGRGINLISDLYNTNQSVTTFGRLQSSMAAFLAYGVNTTGSAVTGYQSSQDAFANRPTTLELGNAYFALKYNTTSSTRTYGTTVSMSTSLYMDGTTGRLGIGTVTPQAIFHVSSSGYNEQYPFLVGFNQLVVSASGNVGIGTTTPSEKLHVSGNLILSSSTTTKININSAAVRTYIASDGAGTSFGSLSNHYVNFYSNNAERMRILSTGEVGINKTTPNATLDVSGSVIISGSLTTTSSVAFKAYTSATSFPGTPAGFLAFDSSGNIITDAGAAINIGNTDLTITSNATRTLSHAGTSRFIITGSNSSYLLELQSSTTGNGRGIAMNQLINAEPQRNSLRATTAGGNNANSTTLNGWASDHLIEYVSGSAIAPSKLKGWSWSYYTVSNTFPFTGYYQDILLISTSNEATLNGSFTVTAGITGSLQGTASFATTASYVNKLNQVVDISGSLNLTGSLSMPGIAYPLGNLSAKIHIANYPVPAGTLTAGTGSVLYQYGAVNEGLILQYGDGSDQGGVKITDDGVAIFGAGDEDIFKVIDEDYNVQRFSINNTGQVGINKTGATGSSTPTNATLDVNGDTIITGSLNVTTNITGSGLLITGSTSSDLVRITQTGAGNAFVIYDVASDSTPFIVDSSGSVGIGSSTAPSTYSSKLYVTIPDFSGWSGIKAYGNNNHAIIGNGVLGYAGIYGEGVAADGSGTVIGVYGYAHSSGEPFVNTIYIGGKFEASKSDIPGGLSGYSVQLKDGTEAAGKVLVSQDDSGSANWSTRLSGSYEITGSLTVTDKIKGTSSNIDTNALIQASLLYLSNNF